MLRTDFGTFKYLGLFSALNVTFLLLSNFTAGRIIGIDGVGVSITVLYFPFTYLNADILTEVYGYAQARSVIWLSLLCSIIAATVVDLALLVPPAGFFTGDAGYQQIFSAAPKMAIATLLAVFTGDICNSYVLAKLKIWSAGRHLWLRFVVSTVLGEGVNTLVFYGIALYGVLPNDLLVQGILMGWAVKTAVEVVLLPVTYPVVAFLKRVEGVDFFDYETDFNPFILAP